jgi:hypothetical protein
VRVTGADADGAEGEEEGGAEAEKLEALDREAQIFPLAD